MKAGYVQFAPEYLAVDTNLERAGTLVRRADADLLVLPELFTSGYFFTSQDDLERVAEPIPEGRTTQTLKEWASETGTTLVAGLAETAKDRVFNSAVLVRPSGDTHTYRKVHLYYEEKSLFAPGDMGFPVFDVAARSGSSYRLGMMVCFDWYFPEAARSLALNGADIIAHPSNLVLPYCPDSMPVRARENHVFTITANRYGTEEKEGEELTFIGMSEICAPDGEILHRADRTGDAVHVVTIEPTNARDRTLNRHNEIFDDRRPETYTTA